MLPLDMKNFHSDDERLPLPVLLMDIGGLILGALGLAVITAIALGLGGCGHMQEMTQPPEDFPKLRVIDHGAQGTLANCSQYTNPFTWPPLGCAEFSFKRLTCEIWYMTDWVRGEELKHCAGRDHAGESTLADAWKNYKETGEEE